MGARNSKRRVGRSQPSITELFDRGDAIDRALRLGVRDALIRHKRLGQRIATWKDGRVVVLEPSEIRIEGAASIRRRRVRTSN